MLWPMSLLAFVGAIVNRITSRAAKHFLSLYLSIRMGTRWVATKARFDDGFDFFVLFIQAFARDALPEITH